MEKIKKFLFTNSTAKQTLTKNTFWLFVGEIISRMLKMAVYIYAARILGTTEWGIFSYAIALIGIFSVFSDIGLNAVLSREVSSQKEDVGNYITTSFWLKTILSAISCVIILLIPVFIKIENGFSVIIPLAALMLFLDSMREFGFALNRAFEKMQIEALLKIVSGTLFFIFGFFLLKEYASAMALAWVYAITTGITVILLFFKIRKQFSVRFKLFKPQLFWPIFNDAWPIATVGIFLTLIISVDTIILGWFKDLSEVGIYAAAQKPVQILALIPGMISASLLPLFSRTATHATDRMGLILTKSISSSMLVIIPIVAGGALLSNDIIYTLFGASYKEAAPILQITIFSVLLSTPITILSNAFFAENKQKQMIEFLAIGALANIGLSLLLIPTLGGYGAAIATTTSQCISGAIIIYKARKSPTLKFSFSIKNSILATTLMIITLIILHPYLSLTLLILSGITLYILVLILMKDKTFSEIRSAITNH